MPSDVTSPDPLHEELKARSDARPQPDTAADARARLDETTHVESDIQNSEAFNDARLVTYQQLGEITFGKKEDIPSDSPAHGMFEWLQNNEGNTRQRTKVLLMMKNIQRKFLDAIEKRAKERGALSAETRQQLGELAGAITNQIPEEAAEAGLVRLVATMGQAYKMHNDEAAQPAATEPQAKTEVFDTEELQSFETYLALMEQVDMEEMVDLIIEDQLFISMLIEAQSAQGAPLYSDYVPGKAINNKDPEQRTIQNFFKLEYENDGAVALKSKLDVSTDNKVDNDHNYVSLARLIAQNERSPNDKSERNVKSINRLAIEAGLWVEIVRRMNGYEREYLTETIQREFGPTTTKNFLKAGLLAGVITPEDLVQMSTNVYSLRWVGEESMKAAAASAQKKREAFKKEKKINASLLERGTNESAVLSFGLSGLAGAALTIAGAATSFLNLSLSFSDAYNDHSNNTWAKKIKDGLSRTMKSGYFWLGVGETGLGIHLISPFTYNDLLHIPESEREVIATAKQQKFFEAQVVNHPQLAPYIASRWDELMDIAFTNKNNANPKQGKQKRGEMQLYDGDFTVDALQARELGFKSSKEAEETIALMFHTVVNTEKIDSKEKFAQYVNEGILKHYDNKIKS